MENKISKLFYSTSKYIQFRLDTTNLLIDKPKFDYQPLPWVGIHKAKIRGEATVDRWKAISPLLINNKSLKDVGCCVGYFCHMATETYSINTIGIDINDRYLRIANFTKSHVLNGHNEIFLNLKIDINTVEMLPQTDATILFSLWHHWVYTYGIDKATEILIKIWNKTNKILFFESGEEETKEEFKLPFNENAKEWLFNYLTKNLSNAKIEKLGEFSAGNYPHYKLKQVKRTVFALMK